VSVPVLSLTDVVLICTVRGMTTGMLMEKSITPAKGRQRRPRRAPTPLL
jgi:hypothetical protein